MELGDAVVKRGVCNEMKRMKVLKHRGTVTHRDGRREPMNSFFKIMGRISRAGCLLLAAFLMTAMATQVSAAIVLDADFGPGEVQGRALYGGDFVAKDGLNGWTATVETEETPIREFVEYALDGSTLSKGYIDILIERKNVAKAEETLAHFLDANGEHLFLVKVLWDSTRYGYDEKGKTVSVIALQQTIEMPPQWNGLYSFGRSVNVGEKVSVRVSWGPSPSDNKVVLAGKSVSVARGYLTWKYKHTKTNLGDVLIDTATLRIGSEREPPKPDIYYTPLSHTIIYDLVVASGSYDTTPPEAVARIIGETPWGGENKVSWIASASTDVVEYEVYRGVGVAPAGEVYQTTSALEYTDTDLIAGLTYYYNVVAVDAVGNKSAPSDTVSIVALAGDGPSLTSITVDPDGKTLRPGDELTVTVTGLSGGVAKATVADIAIDVALAEVGSTGKYVGSYTVLAEDVAATTTSYMFVAGLTDDYGASNLAGPQIKIVGLDIINDVTAPTVASVEHDGMAVAGFSGSLVAEDIFTVTLEGEAGGYASFALAGVTDAQPMEEIEAGVYAGSYTVAFGDEGTDVAVEATLADEAGNETGKTALRTVDVDTRVRLMVTVNDELLPADSESKTRIIVRAENANGDDVEDHELALTLSTTAEYTGVVGGGKVEDKFAAIEDEDDIEVKWGGVTDLFGEIAANYTAGFAAKTALIVAKNLTTGDVGAGWLNTYVASTVAIELTPVSVAKGATASIRMSATPAWLTADGRSKSRIRAYVTDSGGNAISGTRVRFTLAGDNGKVRTVQGVTGSSGMAEADYRAGTVAGMVTVSAEVRDYGATQSIQIELRADAPAKIGLTSSRTVMPADGRSTADIRAIVTDINDNPNKQVPVTFSMLEGSGSVSPAAATTDDNGITVAIYEAGRSAGTAVVEARHTSRAPTEDELRRVYGTIFVPRLMEDQERERIKIAEWFVEAGDEVVKGQAVARLEAGRTSWTLTAPETGILAGQKRFKRDRVELGDTIGYVEIDADIWADQYAE